MRRAFHILKDTFPPDASEADMVRQLNQKKRERKQHQKHNDMGKENVATESDNTRETEIVKPEKVVSSDSVPKAVESSSEIKEDSKFSDEPLFTMDVVQMVAANKARDMIEAEAAEKQAIAKQLDDTHSALEDLKDQMEALKTKHEQDLKKKDEKLQDTIRVFYQTGGDMSFAPSGLASPPSKSSSSQADYTLPRSKVSSRDALREMKRILDSTKETPSFLATSPVTGQQFDCKDYRGLERFIRQNRESCLDALDSGLKQQGLLRGRMGSDAPTVQANLPSFYLEILSALVRETHRPDLVFHQIATTQIAIGYNVGDTVQVPRIRDLSESDNLDDYVLNPETAIVAENEALNSGHVKVELREHGRGGTTTIPPIAIPDFIMATSARTLVTVVNNKLRLSYNKYEDRRIRALLDATTAILYNDGGAVTATVGDVGAGDGGMLTREFLTKVYAYGWSRQIPTLSDGHYILITHPTGLSQLTESIQENSRYISRASMEELTSLFNRDFGGELGKVDGYQFSIGNVHVFATNAVGVGLPGSEGVQSESIGTTRSSFLLGMGTVGRAVAMPFMISRSNNDDFGRMHRYTWRSIEAFAALDIDPASNPPMSNDQQLRVLELRTVDTAL